MAVKRSQNFVSLLLAPTQKIATVGSNKESAPNDECPREIRIYLAAAPSEAD